jgi:hypothetical protein
MVIGCSVTLGSGAIPTKLALRKSRTLRTDATGVGNILQKKSPGLGKTEAFLFKTAGHVFLHFVGEPDCGGPDYSSPLRRLFQFVTFCESLCGFNSAELVSHCDVVEIVSRLIHSLGRYAPRFLDRGDVVANFPPSFVVRELCV